METLPFLLTLAAATSVYLLWLYLLARKLTGPKVWPLVGSLPLLFVNRRRFHDWIAANLRATGGAGTYQTCTIPLPFLARKQGFYTVTCHPKNMEHILRTKFDNYPKGPEWQAAFHDLLGQGIFNSDGETWLIQRKTAALEFTTRTLRQAMARWVNQTIKNRLWNILDKAVTEKHSVDLQELLLRLTFDNICGLTFGKDPETLSPEMPENPFAIAFDTATEATLQRFLYPGILWRVQKLLGIGAERRLKKSLEVVEKYMDDAIAARKENPSDDLLSRFMKKRDVEGNHFPISVLQRIALNFVLAGRDTSSVALSWFFWLVMNHLANEVCGFCCAVALPFIAGSWSPCRAEDVSYFVHEEWAPRILASTCSCIGVFHHSHQISGACLAQLRIAWCLQETTKTAIQSQIMGVLLPIFLLKGHFYLFFVSVFKFLVHCWVLNPVRTYTSHSKLRVFVV